MPAPRITPNTTEQLARAMPALTVVAAILFALAAYGLLFMPKLGRMVSGGDLDLVPFAARIADAQQYKAQLQELRAKYEALNPEIRERVQGIVPAATETQSLYVVFDNLAAANNSALVSIDTAAQTQTLSESGTYPVTGSIGLQGLNYQQFKRLLNDIERSERVIDIQSVVIGSGESGFGLTYRAYGFNPRRLLEAPTPTDGSVPIPAEETLQ